MSNHSTAASTGIGKIKVPESDAFRTLFDKNFSFYCARCSAMVQRFSNDLNLGD